MQTNLTHISFGIAALETEPQELKVLILSKALKRQLHFKGTKFLPESQTPYQNL